MFSAAHHSVSHRIALCFPLHLTLCVSQNGLSPRHNDDVRWSCKCSWKASFVYLYVTSSLKVDRKVSSISRPWHSAVVQILLTDVSFYCDWRLCLETVVTGQEALHLSKDILVDSSASDTANEVQLKFFVLLMVEKFRHQAAFGWLPNNFIAHHASILQQAYPNIADKACSVNPKLNLRKRPATSRNIVIRKKG